MARTKEFDPAVALDAAMRLFWRKGYEATSTGDLVAELGIARASLYGTFGSKHQLYLAALERFIDAGVTPSAADVLASHESALAAIRSLLETSIIRPAADGPAGCFAVNATVEHGDDDPEVSRRLEVNRRRLETALHSALLRAHAQGELADGVDPRAGAAMLVAVNTGLKVLARAGEGQNDRIRSAIDATVSALAA
ncbi:TetR/AcrR family transcriptional regulator [Catenuloplanes sp. NPDC051500]|uniref:TetR/AcrR family transcriptional regulator n=1 Tax=Catenuloplanes sp. NPDC051500 TaxID=3363959 RepID=UPI00378FAB1C